ncbi:M15 family metallopeptidase [Sphingomonas sp. AR_OL41]|uniref:M15 family metallopeptidase n=1 Tax=Sphingomonas sp. AR_OL41 TaxID=3042729 RepID=UPI00248074C0|nr:M15 family metallopeptidase [Sphingomonas sp. AR_OL41]MDH7971830.1 M15 family metallopeptidase [Sphingomonas sp. AR_OL41]
MTRKLRRIIRIAVVSLGLLPALVLAAEPQFPCPDQIAWVGLDGRLFGHIPYAEAAAGDLVPAPAGFGIDHPCYVQRDMLPDLTRLLAAAEQAPGVGDRLRGISCFRGIAQQQSVFCRQIGPTRPCRNAAERALSVAPAGYSEHATGYAIDFAVRPSPRCHDVDPCIATTAAGLWLLAHAAEYGFELSFPAGNAQGVTWEPWHWRWVGASVHVPGAVRARVNFTRARSFFPARPGVNDVWDYWLIQPRPVAASPAPPTAIGGTVSPGFGAASLRR